MILLHLLACVALGLDYFRMVQPWLTSSVPLLTAQGCRIQPWLESCWLLRAPPVPLRAQLTPQAVPLLESSVGSAASSLGSRVDRLPIRLLLRLGPPLAVAWPFPSKDVAAPLFPVLASLVPGASADGFAALFRLGIYVHIPHTCRRILRALLVVYPVESVKKMSALLVSNL
jgi:hypothetical protein